MEQNPFPDLRIESSEFLDDVKGRSKCSKCNKSRKYFCYTCYVSTPDLSDKVPRVKLPLKVDIIKHPSEVDGKSTAVHAGVIAPDDVTIYTFPVIPDYKDKERVAVIFPGPESLTLTQLALKYKKETKMTNGSGKRKRYDSNERTDSCNKSQKSDQLSTTDRQIKTAGDKINGCETHSSAIRDVTDDKVDDTEDGWHLDRVIFIDSTWNQTSSICQDERLKDIQCLQLSDRKTKFWRHHKDNPDTYLSTIEAIYYLVYDFHKIFVSDEYSGEYDNLLFFFRYMYGKIRQMYDGGENLLAYKSRP